MANMNIPVSILGCGIVVLPVNEYEATKQSLAYALEQLHEKERRIEELRGEVEGLKMDKAAIDDHLAACFEALNKIKAIAQGILGSVSHRYMHGRAAEIEKLCDDGLLNRIENNEGEEG